MAAIGVPDLVASAFRDNCGAGQGRRIGSRLSATARNSTHRKAQHGGRCDDVCSADRPLLQVPLGQLKTEIARLQKHLLEMPADGFQSLRDLTEQSLASAKKELQARKPEGANLDRAIAKQRQTTKARTLAKSQIHDCQAAVQRVDLQQAINADAAASQEVQKMRALIAEAEADIREVRAPSAGPLGGPTQPSLRNFLG